VKYSILVTAKVRLVGSKGSYSSTALADSNAGMSLADRSLAERMEGESTGVEYELGETLAMVTVDHVAPND